MEFVGLTRRAVGLWLVGGSALAASIWLIAGHIDTAALRRAVDVAASSPWKTLPALAAFGGAFTLRAALWRRVLPALSLRHAVAAIHVGLAANHLLPLRLGEGVRAVWASRRSGVALRATVASTVMLRSADILALAALGWVLGPAVLHRHLGWLAWAAPLVIAAALAITLRVVHSMPERRSRHLRMPGVGVVAGTVAAWLLEAVLVWFSARWVGIALTPTEAVVVTAASVVAQVAGVAPGGIGTYEAAAAAAYAALGHPGAQGLAAAVVAHALTTAYSLLGGVVAVVLSRLPTAPVVVRVPGGAMTGGSSG